MSSSHHDKILSHIVAPMAGVVVSLIITMALLHHYYQLSKNEWKASALFIIPLIIIIFLSLTIPDNVEHSIEYLIGGIVILVLLYSIIWTRRGFKSTLKMLIIPGLISGLLYFMIRDRTDKLIVNHIKDNKKYYIALAIIIGLLIIAPIIYFKIKSRRNNYIYI